MYKTCNNEECPLKGGFSEKDFCTNCGRKQVPAKGKGICGHDVWLNETYCGICGVYLLHDPRQDDEDLNSIPVDKYDEAVSSYDPTEDPMLDYERSEMAAIRADHDRETRAGL